MTGNLSLLLTCVPYCDQEPFLLTGNSFLLQENYSYDKKFVPMTTYFVIWREIFLTLFMTGILQHGNLFCHITGGKCGSSNKDSLWGLRISCHLGFQDARKNPTLINNHWFDLPQILKSKIVEMRMPYNGRRPTEEDNLKLIKVEYLSSNWSDIYQILNLRSTYCRRNPQNITLKWRWPILVFNWENSVEILEENLSVALLSLACFYFSLRYAKPHRFDFVLNLLQVVEFYTFLRLKIKNWMVLR